MTNDLKRRVAEHQERKPGSFTGRLVYFEHFDDIRQAIARENGIKRVLRAKKIALIKPTMAGFEHRVKERRNSIGILREARVE